MRKLLLIGTATVLSAALSVGVMFAQDSASARPWLGVRVAETAAGVVITQVQAGSPAADANLLVDDVIVTFNTDEITSASDLAQDVQAVAAGDTISVDILRDGSPLTLDLTLGTSPAPAQANRGSGGANFALDPLGLAERLLGVGLDEVESGYQVADVGTGFNPFGLQVGDVVTTLNGQDITALDPNALRFDPSAAPTLSLDVLRDGVTTTLQADLAFGRFGGDDDGGGRFGGDDDGPGQFGGRHGGDNGRQFGGDDDSFGGDDDGGFAPQTQPDSTPAPLTLGNA